MPNRQLTKDEIQNIFKPLIHEIREMIIKAAHNNPEMHWALRRKIVKELGYDEKGHPMLRKQLKAQRFKEQKGICDYCHEALPEKYSELDRIEAINGYTFENTRLVHHECHIKKHAGLKYT